MEEGVEDIVIVGAGIAGLATALGLHRKGVRSLVLEASEVLRISGFALTIWTNAWRALDVLGVGDSIRQQHILLQGFVVSSASGAITSELSFKKRENQGKKLEVRCVKRNILLETLERELPSGTIRYSSKIVSIEEDGNVKILHLTDGSIIKTKVLIGCDGINSQVAKWLGLKKPAYTGRSATRGVAEFSSDHNLKPEFLQIVGKGYRSGLLPCSERSVYWFFTWSPSPEEMEAAEESATKMRQYVLSKLTNVPKEVKQVIEISEIGEVVSTPLRYRSPFSLLWGNITKRNVCVAGDALHPMTPDLGQGGCSALEDSIVLAKCLSEAILEGHKGAQEEYDRIKLALDKYARIRRWRSFQLITTAYLVGFIQQSSGAVITFLRDKFLSRWMAKMLLKMSDYGYEKL
ncbi:monooxygenase 2-like isoform X2 [Typha latifolia]|uniref:monooxygenase 2-like isoform X2 n=1 Tax=Typha latifolia TaxID=4733 RepID=UPI003C2E4E19